MCQLVIIFLFQIFLGTNFHQVQIIAVGDDFNDIGMLKLCGTGVAMKNAIPQVKEVADYETLSNNEDGVAKYIEENIL